MARRSTNPANLTHPLRDPLDRAAAHSPGGAKPPALADNRSEKKNYAQYLSNELATLVAACLRPHFRKARITPREDGSGQEYSVGAKIDSKKTDVGVWDDSAGLILGVSIKTYTFRDFHRATATKPARIGRYQRNVKRNDMELRDEADVLHRRQPYAVLFALLFLPIDACWDGVTGHSSFAHAVFTFRKRAGRRSADAARSDQFEKVFIGLFDDSGHVGFFDVEQAPPRNQPPTDTVSLSALVEQMRAQVTVRNEGVREEDRYAPDDPTWAPPGELPEALDDEAQLDFPSAIDDSSCEDDGADEEDDL